MKKGIIILLTLLWWECTAQTMSMSPSSIRFILNSTQDPVIFAYKNNPAFLARLEKTGAGIYSERKYLLTELNYHSLVAAITTISGGVGVYMDYRGSPIYNESRISLAHGRNISSNIQLGLQLNWNAISASEYGKGNVFIFSAGTVFQLSDNLRAGIMLEERLNKKMGSLHKEKWPGTYGLTFFYDVSDKFSMGAEMIKWQGQPLQVMTACEYQPLNKIKLLGGISIPDVKSLIGINYFFGALNLGVYMQHHLQLGVSPGISISIYFKKKEK